MASVYFRVNTLRKIIAAATINTNSQKLCDVKHDTLNCVKIDTIKVLKVEIKKTECISSRITGNTNFNEKLTSFLSKFAREIELKVKI